MKSKLRGPVPIYHVYQILYYCAGGMMFPQESHFQINIVDNPAITPVAVCLMFGGKENITMPRSRPFIIMHIADDRLGARSEHFTRVIFFFLLLLSQLFPHAAHAK